MKKEKTTILFDEMMVVDSDGIESVIPIYTDVEYEVEDDHEQTHVIYDRLHFIQWYSIIKFKH